MAMTSRLTLSGREDMTEEQAVEFDAIVTSRGTSDGPFLAWLYNPLIARHAQQLGRVVRFGTELDAVESELVILHAAAHYRCPLEQQVHEEIVRKSGSLSDDVLRAIREFREPPLSSDRLQACARVARALLEEKRLDDTLYRQAVDALGERALVEIVAVLGYFALVTYTLNAFEMRRIVDH
jgi:4-carboxymuconolactone decarboxylase